MTETLAQALLAAQKDAPPLTRDSENPHFRNKFVSLETLMQTVLPVLNKHGLVLLQHPTTVDGQPALRSRLVHAASGESEEDTMLLLSAKLDPQAQGSALTYARRYSLMAMLGLVADEDDDGQRASSGRERAAGRGTGPPAASETFRPDGSEGGASTSSPGAPPSDFNPPDMTAEIVRLEVSFREKIIKLGVVAENESAMQAARASMNDVEYAAWLTKVNAAARKQLEAVAA